MGMHVWNERRDVTHAQLANILMTERPTKKLRSTQEECLPPALCVATTRRPRHISS